MLKVDETSYLATSTTGPMQGVHDTGGKKWHYSLQAVRHQAQKGVKIRYKNLGIDIPYRIKDPSRARTGKCNNICMHAVHHRKVSPCP